MINSVALDFAVAMIVVGVAGMCIAVAVGISWLARRWRRNHSTIWRVR